ncbi:MAG: serine/threonine protein kinase [Xanthomonadales bacterium PRO6]|nr:serine/threonine protein kinase [Xanthomonadales bacterium PRO6]
MESGSGCAPGFRKSRPLATIAESQADRPMIDPSAPQIPGYELLDELGVGGMATVYLAKQTSLDRKVAIKIMRVADHAHDPERSEKRFLREGRMLARLAHKNVCGIYDIAKVGQVAYIAMEYIEGGTLGERLRRGMTAADAVSVIVQLAAALSAAHALGIVHRDLKPANVMMRGTVPVLTDFGIARDLSPDRTEITGDNILGTPHYMSPEQISGQPIDGRSDVYSLGCMLYELLTGRQPFQGDSPIAVCMQHLQAPIPQLSKQFAGLQTVIDGMMAKDPGTRLADMASVVMAIRTALAESPDLQQALRFDTALPLSEQLRLLGFSFDHTGDEALREALKRPPMPAPRPPVQAAPAPHRPTPDTAPPRGRARLLIGAAAALLLSLLLGWWVLREGELSEAELYTLEALASTFDNQLHKGELVLPADKNAAKTLALMRNTTTRHPLVVDRRASLRAAVERELAKRIGDEQYGAARNLLSAAAIAFESEELEQKLAQLDQGQLAQLRDGEIARRVGDIDAMLARGDGLADPALGSALADLAIYAGVDDPDYKALSARVAQGLTQALEQAVRKGDLIDASAQRDRLQALLPDSPAALAAAQQVATLTARLGAQRNEAEVMALLRRRPLTAGALVEAIAGIEAIQAADLQQAAATLRGELLQRTDAAVAAALQAARLDEARGLLEPALRFAPDSAPLRALESRLSSAERALAEQQRAADEAARAGTLVVDAQPWGKVLKVVSADGREQDLGRDPRTPLPLTLPEGRYTITVQGPDGRSQQVAAANVGRGDTHVAELRFAALDADAYLRQAGFR